MRISIALEGTTKVSSSYTDLRVRYLSGSDLENFHILEIPICEEHTGEKLFNLLSSVITSLSGEMWKNTLIKISKDGTANVVKSIQGPTTQTKKFFGQEAYLIWCGARQLELTAQATVEENGKQSLTISPSSLIFYMRRETNLIALISSQFPTVSEPR